MSEHKSTEERCFVCEAPATDQCPECKKFVCRLCAESEGESCCDFDYLEHALKVDYPPGATS